MTTPSQFAQVDWLAANIGHSNRLTRDPLKLASPVVSGNKPTPSW